MTERIWNDCPECGKACRFKADYVGDLGRCNHCDAEFRIRKPLPVALAVAEPVRHSPEEKILDVLAEWLEHREFMIEGKWQNPNSRTEVWTGKAVGFAAKRLAVALIGHRLPGLRTGVSGGATPEQIGKAMEPILSEADFVAVQFGSLFSTSKANRIIAVILADDLRPNDCAWERIESAGWKSPPKFGLDFVADGNCVVARRGGEQPEANDRSVG